MEDKKQQQTAEQSLRYMAWDMKGIGKELAKLNVLLEALLKEKRKDPSVPF